MLFSSLQIDSDDGFWSLRMEVDDFSGYSGFRPKSEVLILKNLQGVLLRAWHVQGNLVNAEFPNERDFASLILQKKNTC